MWGRASLFHIFVDGGEQTLAHLIHGDLLPRAGAISIAGVSIANLRDAIWDTAGEYVSDNSINVYIRRLRERIEDDPAHPEVIVTARGLGYRIGAGK